MGGSRRPRGTFTGAAAAEVLAGIPRVAGNPFVFPGEREGSHWVNVERSWRRIRRAAGFPELRMHDLRHSYAAVGAAAGLGLPVIGRILGHTQASTTQRYTHFADDPLRAAADRISSEIAAALSSAAAGEVIPVQPPGDRSRRRSPPRPTRIGGLRGVSRPLQGPTRDQGHAPGASRRRHADGPLPR